MGARRGRASVSCRCVWVRVGDGTWGLREAEAGGAAPRAGAGDAAERLDHAARGRALSGSAGQTRAEPFTELETETVTGERLGNPDLTHLPPSVTRRGFGGSHLDSPSLL